MDRLSSIAFVFLVVISVIDAGAQQSKPTTSLKISVKDVTLAISGPSEESLGPAKQ